MAGVLAVFDFDKTIVDVDSDNWVVDELGFADLFDRMRPAMDWNSLMDAMMKEMHDHGVKMEDVGEVLRRIPVQPRVVEAIKAAHDAGCDLRIVSDANVFFIETVLDHLGVKGMFSEINTNPGYVDEEGRLRIRGFHDFSSSPHGCHLCPPNMCKGKVLERLLKEQGSKKLIYLGDGSGDYCPSLKLRPSDFVMPRRDYPAHELIRASPKLVAAEVHLWADGTEMETVLLHIVDTLTAATKPPYNAVDCKFQMACPLASSEAMPAALSFLTNHVTRSGL